jgi:hypothetical protein
MNFIHYISKLLDILGLCEPEIKESHWGQWTVIDELDLSMRHTETRYCYFLNT